MGSLSSNYPIKALFGGAFDPPHYGHLLPLQETADITGLESISLMPANIPVFKKDISPAKHRIAMTRLLCNADSRFDVDLTEFSRDEVSYTIDTLMYIKQRDPQQTLIFIIGEDSLLTLHLWERYQALFDYCHILVMLRPSTVSDDVAVEIPPDKPTETKLASKLYSFHTKKQAIEIIKSSRMSENDKTFLFSKLAIAENDAQCINRNAFKDIIGKSATGKLWLINNTLLPVSSTNIRQRIKAGKAIDRYVPTAISDYIVKHKLYNK